MRRRYLNLARLVTLATIVALVLVACGKAEQPSDQPAEEPQEEGRAVEGDVYRIAILDDMTTTNLWNLLGPGSSAYNFVVQLQYYPALFGQSEVRYDFVPSIAADFATPLEQEGDFWVSTVKMKEDAIWSDGAAITAEDVAFTANTALEFQLGGNWQGSYDWDFLDHVEAVDAYTVKFVYHTKPGLATHEYGALQGAIASKAFWEPKMTEAIAALQEAQRLDSESEEYATALAEAQELLYTIEEGASAVGEAEEAAFEGSGEHTAGPYMFKTWYPGSFTENAKNDKYYFDGAVIEEYTNGAYRESKEEVYELQVYGDATGDVDLTYTSGPNFKSVIYTVYEQEAAVLALLAGEVDYIYNPTGFGPGLEAQLRNDPNVGLVTNPQNGFRFMAFNFDSPPLDDVAVRQALACVIDKDFLAQSILQGAVLPTHTPVPAENAFWYNDNVTLFCDGFSAQERLDWAVKRLKDAGYTWDVEPSWNEDRGGSAEWGEGLKMPDGEYVPELLLLAPSAGYDPLRATTGVFVEQWANQLGLPVKANLTNFNNILAETLGGGGNYDMAITGWGLGDMFPDHLCIFWKGGAVPFNFMNYANAEFDAICDQFNASTDLEEAREYALQLQEILATDLPYIYIWRNPIKDAYRVDTIQYPFTELLDGLQGEYGLQDLVMVAE